MKLSTDLAVENPENDELSRCSAWPLTQVLRVSGSSLVSGKWRQNACEQTELFIVTGIKLAFSAAEVWHWHKTSTGTSGDTPDIALAASTPI